MKKLTLQKILNIARAHAIRDAAQVNRVTVFTHSEQKAVFEIVSLNQGERTVNKIEWNRREVSGGENSVDQSEAEKDIVSHTEWGTILTIVYT